LIVLTIKLDAESTCYENRIDQPHIGSGVIEGAESGVANLNMPTTAPYWCDTPDGGGYPDDRIEETAFGYNIAKEYVQCDVKPAAECPAIYGEPHAFADQCREEGHTAISCSCSQFLCTGKIDFKGFNP
jgi:hypothetical protein